MKNNLLFDFSVDKENKRIHVKREFSANLELVWQAWTNPELLEQWWAPKPWKAQTKSMDFREGGHWLYAMLGPDGEKHWSKVDYIAIEKEKSFVANDAFSDEDGKINPDFPQTSWDCSFNPHENRTLVNITLTFNTFADLEKIIEMGFKEGFTMGLDQLEELLNALKNQQK